MFALPKSDPLDVLVYGIGLRLTQLAKMGDPKFKKLLENRNFSIQMGSESQDVYRTFIVENGRFSQAEGKAVNPTLTIDFKDSMTGAKLLTKGDATAFMSGIQNGDVKMSGDYSLLMWFNQVAKHIVPKIPEPLQPAVEMAKPLLTKATPVAKDLCDKAMSLLAGFGILGGTSSKSSDKSEAKDHTEAKKDEPKSKYFGEKSDDKTEEKTDEKSLLDTAKEKLADVKADVEEKMGELKEKAEEELAEVKEKAEDLTTQAKDKVAEVKEVASGKVEQVKSDAETKVAQVKEKNEDLTAEAKDKLEAVKSEAETKVADVKDVASEKLNQAKDKVAEVKTEASQKLADVKDVTSEKLDTTKDKVAEVKTEATEKLADVKTQVAHKVSDVKEDVKEAVKDTATQAQHQANDKQVVDKLNAEYQVKDVKKDEKDTADSEKLSLEALKAEALSKVRQGTTSDEDSLTPALQKSHELEAKHADDEVIAEDVTIPAVKDDKSPITGVSVTKKA